MSKSLLNQLTKKCFSLIIITLLCILLLAHSFFLKGDAASVNGYEAGVLVGDWIEYNLTWNPIPPFDYTLYIRREILNVNGALLTINTTQVLSNGTITSETKTGSVVDGTSPCTVTFIPANLKTGDIVTFSYPPDQFRDVTIDGETTLTYFGTERTVVYAEDFQFMGFDIDAYWDKEKGVALEINSESTYSTITTVMRTNMWTSSSGNPLLGSQATILIIILISLAFILLYGYMQSTRRKTSRRKKKSSH